MQLTFEQDDAARRIRGNFRLGQGVSGRSGFVHGGIIATLLDEAMGKVNRFRGLRALTAELTIEYLRPVPVEQDIVVEALRSGDEGTQSVPRGRNSERAGDVVGARDAGDSSKSTTA